MRKARYIIGGLLLVAAIALSPAIKRTAEYVLSSAKLVHVAGLPNNQVDRNPWSESGILVGQETAVWILRTFDFPYRNRVLLNEPVPLINIAATRDQSDEKADQRLLEVVEILIERGEPLEDRHLGYTAVQGAVLTGDVEMVRTLVEAGADLHAPVESPGSRSHGMNAFELNELLVEGAHPEWHQSTAEYLRSLDQPY